MQRNHSEMRPSVRNESDNLTFSRRYFFWYTLGAAACGTVSGASLLWLVLTTLKALGGAA